MSTLAGLATHRPWRVLLAFLALAAVGLGLSGTVSGRLSDGLSDYDDPASASAQARVAVQRATGIDAEEGYTLLIRLSAPAGVSSPPPASSPRRSASCAGARRSPRSSTPGPRICPADRRRRPQHHRRRQPSPAQRGQRGARAPGRHRRRPAACRSRAPRRLHRPGRAGQRPEPPRPQFRRDHRDPHPAGAAAPHLPQRGRWPPPARRSPAQRRPDHARPAPRHPAWGASPSTPSTSCTRWASGSASTSACSSSPATARR